MAITAAQVKELRERTGSGMMECKKALVETEGNIEAAIDALRKSGLAKADKKAGRIAADGVIALQFTEDNARGVMVEINSETDFVAKGDEFKQFTSAVTNRIIDGTPENLEALLAMPYEEGGSDTFNEARQRLVAKIGEKISIRRFADFSVVGAVDGIVGGYLHGSRIAVLVELKGGTANLAKDIAMHIAASQPVCISADEVPKELIEKEKEIFSAQAADSGKPAEIIEKMVAGRIKKYLKEITLIDQSFVKNPDITVAQLLKDSNAAVVRFTRFEVGEGIEKKEENFAEEVMSQVRGG